MNAQSVNLAIAKINTWNNELNEKFVYNIQNNIHILEKTKIIKKNILNTLDVAHKIASMASNEEIFETSQSKENIELEMDKIRKDVISIAVFGQMSSGKSSFLNSLVGEELLTVKQSRATAIITVIRHIDNFDSKKDGEVEINYKSVNEILRIVDKTLSELNEYFPNLNFNSYITDSLDEFDDMKTDLSHKLENLDFSEISAKEKKIVRGLKKLLILIIDGYDENKAKLGQVISEDFIDKTILTSEEKSVFITSIIFYKDIPLLKDIELVDTPGLGSNSLLDTRKSEAFIEMADIVMVLTDAREPMQKESEVDIFDQLSTIQHTTGDHNVFDKVFIIINKIDESESSRDEMKALLLESLEDIDMTQIKDSNIMFVSAFYEYQKKFSSHGLEKLSLKNASNIGTNDLEIIEKTIYDFSALEATNRFLNENIIKIEDIFVKAKKYFEENINKINNDIEITERKITQFEKNKENIKEDLHSELEEIVDEKYKFLLGISNYNRDKLLKEFGTYIYAEEKAKIYKIFDYAKDDNTSNNHYEKIGKKFIQSLILEINKRIEKMINSEVFNEKERILFREKLQGKAKEIQEKYENEYGVLLDFKDVKIDAIKIDLEKSINLEISYYKSLKMFFNPFTWGKYSKYIDAYSEKWEEYTNNHYNPVLKDEIKENIQRLRDQVQSKINREIKNIVETIEIQLNQELKDKEKYSDNKEATVNNKKSIQEAFEKLQNEYIEVAKNQNIDLIK